MIPCGFYQVVPIFRNFLEIGFILLRGVPVLNVLQVFR
ncbi:hypothetical protein NHE_0467 [Neorickettsia helminthoeca str. Oregon]|uniref:Uncharacterized protein n=1 Tax=Neorickettsia helminthoeca str. Oregon TaxID=1286528 RepID=X5H4B8_9RICK|nr:hypothetical protein NHE_0467 [Neorickettsia helminthoeca str. Oregon]